MLTLPFMLSQKDGALDADEESGEQSEGGGSDDGSQLSVAATHSVASASQECAVPGSDCDRFELTKQAMKAHQEAEHNVQGSPVARRVRA